MDFELDKKFAEHKAGNQHRPTPPIGPTSDMFQSREISVLKCENFRLRNENEGLRKDYEKAISDSLEAIELAHAQNELISDMNMKIRSLEAKLTLKQTVDKEMKEYIQFLEYVLAEAHINIDDYRDYSDVES